MALLALLALALLAPASATHSSPAAHSWKIEVLLPKGGSLLVKPAYYRGELTVFVPDNSSLLGIRAADGVLVLNTSFPEPIVNYAVLGNGVVVVTRGGIYSYMGGEPGMLARLSNDSFSPITGMFMPVASARAFLPLNHSLAVVTLQDYRLLDLESDVQHIMAFNGMVAAAFTNNTVVLMDPSTLEQRWSVELSLKGRSGIYLMDAGGDALGISAAMVVNETAEENRLRGFMVLVNASTGSTILNTSYTDEFPVAARLAGSRLYVVTYQPAPLGGSMGLYAYMLGSAAPFLNKTLSDEAGAPVFLTCSGKLRILLYTHYYNISTWPPLTRPMLQVYSSEGGELHRYIVSTEAQAYMQVGGFKALRIDDDIAVIMVYMPYVATKPVVLFYVPSPDPCLVSRLTEGYWGREALYASSIVAVLTLASLTRRGGEEE